MNYEFELELELCMSLAWKILRLFCQFWTFPWFLFLFFCLLLLPGALRRVFFSFFLYLLYFFYLHLLSNYRLKHQSNCRLTMFFCLLRLLLFISIFEFVSVTHPWTFSISVIKLSTLFSNKLDHCLVSCLFSSNFFIETLFNSLKFCWSSSICNGINQLISCPDNQFKLFNILSYTFQSFLCVFVGNFLPTILV